MVFAYRPSHIRRDIPVKITEYSPIRGKVARFGPGAQGNDWGIFLNGRGFHGEKIS